MTTQQCCTDQELSDFELGNLPGPQHEELARHLDECPNCATRFEELAPQIDAVLDQLRLPLPDEILQNDAELVELAAQAVALFETGVIASEETAIGTPQRTELELRKLIAETLGPPQSEDELGRLGHYRVLKVLGVGGMGVVFQAEDTQLRRSVALKVMKPTMASDVAARERFLREARSMAAIEHDHVATIHQVEDGGTVPFLAMPLLKGESLASCLRREKKLPSDEALRITREVCLGLIAAHANGLIHRDIKPDNIWLEHGTGRVKILDFGLARAFEAQQRLTQSGLIVGTPKYLSPEQASGQSVDARSDLFSLGTVLYEMLSGTHPFERENLLATLNAIGSEIPEIATDVDADIAALVNRLLEKSPEERYQSAEEVIAGIDTCGKRDERPRVTATDGTFPPRRGNHLAWLGGFAALILLAGIIVTVKDKDGNVIARLVGSTVEVTHDDEHDGSVEMRPTPVKPSGQPKAVVADNETNASHNPLALTSTPEQVAGLKSWTLETRLHRSEVHLLQASSDGQNVASAGDDGTIRIWRSKDFAPVQILYRDTPQDAVRSIAWSRDGRHLCYLMPKQAVILETENWQEVRRIPGPGGNWHGQDCEWSTAGRLLLSYGDGHVNRSLFVVDAESGRRLRSTAAKVQAHWEDDSERIRTVRHVGDVDAIIEWDVDSDVETSLGEYVNGAVYAPDFSRYVQTDSDAGQWFVKSREDGQLLCEIPRPSDQPYNASLTWSPNGHYLAWSDFAEQKLSILDVETGEFVGGGEIPMMHTTLGWLSDGEQLLVRSSLSNHQVAAAEPNLMIVNVTTDHIRRVEITQSAVRPSQGGTGDWRFTGPWAMHDIVWSPDGKQLLSQGNGLWLWSLDGARSTEQLEEYDPYKGQICWPFQDLIVGKVDWGGPDSGTWRLDLQTRLLTRSESFGRRLGASADGRRSVFHFRDSEDHDHLRIVDATTGQQVNELRLPDDVFPGSDAWGFVSPDGNLLATTVRSKPDIQIWSLQDGSLLQTINAQEILGNITFNTWTECFFSPDNSRAILRVDFNGELTSLVWDFESRSLIRKLHFDPPFEYHSRTKVAWIDNNRFIHSGENRGLVLFDRDGNQVDQWGNAADDFAQVAVSPDRSLLACSNWARSGWGRGYIQIRNLADGQLLSTHCVLPTKHGYDLPLSFSPTGHWRGAEELNDLLCYVVEKNDGRRRVLTPKEFTEQFGWVNEPQVVGAPYSKPEPDRASESSQDE